MNTLNTAQERLDDTADAAHKAIDTGWRVASDEIGRIADKASGWRDKAGDLAQQGTDWARDGTDRVRREVTRASDRAVGYVRDEPMRAALMAVAAGAVIYALVRLSSSLRGRR